MLFAIGTRVRFKYTGETGAVTSLEEDGVVQIRLDSDPALVIPGFIEDLERDLATEPRMPGAKFVAGKAEKTPEAPPRREVKSQYVILKPDGVQIAFEPMPGRDGTIAKYKIWLLNDTDYEFLVEFDLYIKDKNPIRRDDKLTATSAIEMGDMLADSLNDAPEVELTAKRVTTAGLDQPLFKSLKIKPKTFFNNLKTAAVLNVPAHLFVMFSQFEQQHEPDPIEQLQAYTRQHAAPRTKRPESNSRPYQPLDIEAVAAFVPEIDLHAENLFSGQARVNPKDILRLQMMRFEQFIDKALKVGVSHVFVIHGVGEGILRDAIAKRLNEMPHVREFKNEYHPKYGYGATEIIF